MAFCSILSQAAMLCTLTFFLSSFPSTVVSFQSFERLPLPPRGFGPEAYAFDSSGQGPYTGIMDGRIVKYQNSTNSFVDFAFDTPTRSKAVCDGNMNALLGEICGRPVGIGIYNRTGELYAADAYRGLVVVGPNGGPGTTVATSADKVRFRFPDGLDIDQETGCMYFTDASAVFGISEILLAVLLNDATGRLIKYDPKARNVTVLLRGLGGAAGVAVSADSSYVLVTEFIAQRIQKYWLTGPKANTSEILVTFPGRPDNIKRTASGDYWVAVNIQSQPISINNPTAIKIDGSGNILSNVSLSEQYNSTLISEVQEYGKYYYVGSMFTNFVGRYKMS